VVRWSFRKGRVEFACWEWEGWRSSEWNQIWNMENGPDHLWPPHSNTGLVNFLSSFFQLFNRHEKTRKSFMSWPRSGICLAEKASSAGLMTTKWSVFNGQEWNLRGSRSSTDTISFISTGGAPFCFLSRTPCRSKAAVNFFTLSEKKRTVSVAQRREQGYSAK